MNSNDIRIDVYLAGADKAIASMRTLQENADRFSRKTLKKKIEIETKNAQKSIDAINKKLLALEKERLNARKELLNMPKGEGGALRKYIQEITLKMQELRLKTREVKAEMQGMRQIDITPRLDWGFFTRVSSVIRNIGSSMLSLSGAIGRLTAPLDMLTRGTLYSAAFTGLNKITEGLSGAFERYDTMETYSKIMKQMGVSTKTATQIIGKNAGKAADQTVDLYQAVLGLPTGLDEIVDAQKQYFLATKGNYKDMDKAARKSAKIAIAANNAFVAGGASPDQVMFGQRQVRDLLAKGKLRATEWESLMSSMPLAISEIQKKLKVSRSDLKENKVSAEDFVDALIEVGTGTGKVAKATEEMKHTFKSVSANITNSLRSAGYETLKVLDEIFKTATGGDVIDQLLKIKPAIEETAESAREWIKAHPEKVIEFFNLLKKINPIGVIKGMAQGLAPFAKAFAGLVNLFSKSGSGGEGFGKMIISLHLFGKVLGVLGGFTKGSAPMWAFGAMLVRFFKTTEAASKLAKVSIVSRLVNFFNRFKKVEKGVKAVEGAETAAAGAAGATASVGTLLTNLLKVVTPAITIGAYAGAFALVGKTLSSFGKSLKEIGDLKVNWTGVIKNAGGMGLAITGLIALGKILGDATVASGGALGIALGVGGLEIVAFAELGKEVASAMKQIADSVNAISDVRIPDDAKIDEIGEVVNKILTIYDKIDTGKWSESFGRRMRSRQDKKFLKNIQEITGSIGTTLSTIKDIADTIKKISDLKAVYYYIKRAKIIVGQIKRFSVDLFDILQSLDEGDFGREESGAGVARYEHTNGLKDATKKFEKMASFFEQMDSLMQNMEAIPKHFIRIKEKMKKLKDAFTDKEGNLDTTAITDNIKNIVGVIEAVVNEGGLGKLKDASNVLKNTNLDNITTQLDKIPTVLKSLQTLRDFFKKNGTNWLTPTGTKNITQGNLLGGAIGGKLGAEPTYEGNADTMIKSIERMVAMVVTIGQKLASVPDISSNADTLKKGITATYNAYIMLNRFSNFTKKYKVNTDNIKTTISDAIEDLSSGLNDAPRLFLNSSLFKQAVKNLQSGIKSITTSKTGSISTFVSYLKKIPRALEAVNTAMKGRGTAWKNQLVSGFKSTAQDILTQIQNISLALAGNTYYANFYQAGANAGTSYSNGFNNSINLQTPDGATVTTTTKTTTKTKTTKKTTKLKKRPKGNTGDNNNNPQLKSPNFMASGGEVYGESGIDRVPAMLTSGEYVMQRRATKGFGSKFMQRINNLDIVGAIKALGMRGGQLAYATPTVNIDNSKHVTYNNNQSVNMTNNHASQGYSEARASRYLRKM